MARPAGLLCLCLGLCAAAGTLDDACGPESTADEVATGSDLHGKVAVITGGDSGLGYATASALARVGATVLIGAHNTAKGEKAAQNISTTTGGDARSYPLDLSSFASVRTFAADVLKDSNSTVDYLINDAGVTGNGGDKKTADGFDSTFEINYLGHFLLTELLLPALRKGVAAGTGHVVNVASTEHMMACPQAGFPGIKGVMMCLIDFTYLPPPVEGEKGSLYGFTKALMIKHAEELSLREKVSGVKAYSLCPGLVATDMPSSVPGFVNKTCDEMKKMWWNPFIPHQAECPYPPEVGAAVIVYAALKAPTPGGWYTRYNNCKDSTWKVISWGMSDAMRSQLYDKSREWAGLNSSADARVDDMLVV